MLKRLWWPVTQHLARQAQSSGTIAVLKDSLRNIIHEAIGQRQDSLTLWGSLTWFVSGWKRSLGYGASFGILDGIYNATKPDSYRCFLIGLQRHRRLIDAVLSALCIGALGFAAYRFSQRVMLNMQPFEPEGLGHPGCMVEVTQEDALGVPTHFACPAGLRAHILEKIFLCERGPQLFQRVKSMAGRWCDDHQINPFQRPACIAGAVAAAMTVSVLETDLIRYESRWEVQQAQQRVRQHAAGQRIDNRPRFSQIFWDWLTDPGRR